MTFLNEVSLADALTKCYTKPRTKIAIHFSSEEHFAEFSDIMFGMAAMNQLAGVKAPSESGEFDTIEFMNGSYIKCVRKVAAKDSKDSFWEEGRSEFQDIIYDYDPKSHELDDFLDSFHIVECV